MHRRGFRRAGAAFTLWAAFCGGARAQGPAASGPARRVIVLDPGHGGYDWGAVRPRTGLMEKDLVLAMARKVKERLEKASGADVRLTREDDTFLRLDQRIRKSLDLDADIFVSLHVNQTRNTRNSGITVYSFGAHNGARLRLRRRMRAHLPQLPPPPRERAHESAALASSMVASLRSDGLRVDPIARAQYYVLKNPEVPSVLIEMGYISNADEAKRLADPEYQDRLASAIARSLASYLARGEGPSRSTDLALGRPK